jgi:hypothetical protein
MKNRHPLMVLFAMIGLTLAPYSHAEEPAPTPMPAPTRAIYTVPLHFAPKDNGVEIKDYEFHYALSSQDDLDVNGVSIKNSEISLELSPPDGSTYKIKFSWPHELLPQGGTVELKNPKDGEIFYSREISSDTSNYEMKISQKDLEHWKSDIPFRYCMGNTINDLKHSFCSKAYILFSEESKFQIKDFKEYRKEQDLKEKMSGKKIVLAKDQAKLNISFYPQGEESKIESIDLPVSEEFIKSKAGGISSKNFSIKPENAKKGRTIKIDEEAYDRNDTLKKLAKFKAKTNFKFCAADKCSKVYILMETSRNFLIDQVSSSGAKNSSLKDLPQDITADDKPLGLKDTFVVKKDKKTAFRALLANGGEFFIETSPPAQETDLFDIIQSEDRKSILLSGSGFMPVAPEITKNPDDTWQASLDGKKPSLTFLDPGNMPIMLPLKITKSVPTQENRAQLKARSRKSSYKNSVFLHGALNENSKLQASSTETEAIMHSDNTFEWDFLSNDKGAINHRLLKLSSSNENFIAHYDIYRGYPFEGTLRFNSVVTEASTFLVQGELGASAWLEQFFTSENYWLSRQRWGSSLRYLTTIVDAKNQAGNSVKFSTINFDIKYNIKPGVWNHDEMYGALLNYQSVTFSALSGSMLGIGGYYGRPMFKKIDAFLNKVKFLRYPKWVDAQADYYFMPATSTTVMGRNFNIITHMKLFLKPNFFLEAGLGYKQFDFISQSTFLICQTNIFSGTLGAGLDF